MFGIYRNNELKRFSTHQEARKAALKYADTLSQLWSVVKIENGKWIFVK